jgi:hypothetical protein
VNAPQNMVAYGIDTFSARDFVRAGLALTVIALALVMLLATTYWRWLGYVQGGAGGRCDCFLLKPARGDGCARWHWGYSRARTG